MVCILYFKLPTRNFHFKYKCKTIIETVWLLSKLPFPYWWHWNTLMIMFAVHSTCVKGIRHLMIFRHKPNRTYLNIQDLPQQHCADELSLLKIPLILSTQVWRYLPNYDLPKTPTSAPKSQDWSGISHHLLWWYLHQTPTCKQAI